MNALPIARKEFADTARSRMLWALTGLLVVLTAGGVVAVSRVFDGLSTSAATQFLSVPATQVLPLAALVAGYLAVAGERESGSIRVLLGLPATRRDVVVGKWLGRTAVVTVAVVVAFLAGGATVVATTGGLSVWEFVVVTCLTALFALAYVAIAVGVSSLAATRARAMAGAVGVFAVFGVVWQALPAGLLYLIEGRLPSPGEAVPAWYLLVDRLNPANAYEAARSFLLGAPESSYVLSPSGTRQGAAPTLAELVEGPVPFFAEYWFGLVVLLAWVVVPVAVGYWRFRAADLG